MDGKYTQVIYRFGTIFCVCVCVVGGGVWDGKSSTPHTNKLDMEFKPDFSFKYHS